MTQSKTPQQNFITYLRAFGALCIIACHLCNECDIAYIAMLGQFFNIGVCLFFMVSGFCFGIQKDKNWNTFSDIKAWWIKRLKRIFPSYWLFLAVLTVVYLITGKQLPVKNLISCIFAVQGANVGFLGADQTWFISGLFLCYIFTPIIAFIYDKIKQKTSYIITLLIILSLIPVLLAVFKSPSIGTLGTPICFYSISFIIGRLYKKMEPSFKIEIVSFSVMCLAFLGRIVGRVLADDTWLYDRIISTYTQYIAAFCIALLFAQLLNNRESDKITKWICKVSFEVYLYHYMFVQGPLSLMSATSSWIVNSLIVTCVSFAVATLFNCAVSTVSKKLNSKTKY